MLEHHPHFLAMLVEFIVLLKETSVAGYIALQDLTKGGDIERRKVDFPEPDGPTITTTSPFLISSEIPSSA